MDASLQGSQASLRERLARVIVTHEALANFELPLRSSARDQLADLAALARSALRVRDESAAAYIRLLEPQIAAVQRIIALDLLGHSTADMDIRRSVEGAIALFGWDWPVLQMLAEEGAALEAHMASADERASALALDDELAVFSQVEQTRPSGAGSADSAV